MWVVKKLVVRFGVKNFTERTLAAWWVVLETFIKDRQDALLPGPIKGLAQFLLRVDTKVTSLLVIFVIRSKVYGHLILVFLLHPLLTIATPDKSWLMLTEYF